METLKSCPFEEPVGEYEIENDKPMMTNEVKQMQKAIRKGLLPCPHCGGRARLWQAYDSSWCVQCDKCGANTMKVDKEEAVKRWNRRVKDG